MVDHFSTYIYQKRGFYYFSRRVPKEVQRCHDKRRIVLALNTRSRAKALRHSIDAYHVELLKDLKTENWNTFKSTTINEHPKPLKQMWNRILENSEKLTAELVWQEFLDHLMITVTKEEDRAMPRSDGDIATRYKGIEVFTIDADPYSYTKK